MSLHDPVQNLIKTNIKINSTKVFFCNFDAKLIFINLLAVGNFDFVKSFYLPTTDRPTDQILSSII